MTGRADVEAPAVEGKQVFVALKDAADRPLLYREMINFVMAHEAYDKRSAMSVLLDEIRREMIL